MGQEGPAQGALVPMGALPAPGGCGTPGAAAELGPSEHPPQQIQRLPHLDHLTCSLSVTQEGAEAGGAKGGCAHAGTRGSRGALQSLCSAL